VSVRFGNVLGSRGSVLTAFAEQIRAGGPVTVTDPDVTRFFMTVSEAVQLVLQAGAVGQAGDVLILDMGDPVRILDVAHQLMRLMDRDVDVVITGLRPGEKLHEVLHGPQESLGPTRHPLISRAAVPPLGVDEAMRRPLLDPDTPLGHRDDPGEPSEDPRLMVDPQGDREKSRTAGLPL
jgi:FlaA1/EpsC-like NDP-sugar epimerase